MNNKSLWYGVVTCVLVGLDRITKLWALRSCTQPILFNQYLSCELAFNRGVSWSLLSFSHTAGFIVVTLLVTSITLFLMHYAWQQHKAGQNIWGEILVVAGSCGNIIDRLLYGGVIDFIALSYQTYTWPLFNIADICVVCGVGLMLLKIYKQ